MPVNPTNVYVGLDIHRKSIVTCVKDQDGKVLDQSKLGAGDDELQAYLSKLPGSKHIVLEACTVWEHVFDACKTVTEDVVLAHPSKVRLIAEASLKSDKVDSEALCELLRLNGIPRAYAPDETTRAQRKLVRDRHFYKRLQTAIKNHVYSVLLAKGIAYEDGALRLKGARAALRLHSIPEVNRGIDALEQLEALCRTVDERVTAAFLASPEAKLLISIPGIGEFTALALVAELCPISRFGNVEKISSYCGLVPTNWQSGETSYQGRMKKQASPFVKQILIEASWMHRRWADRKSDVVKIGNRVARRGGSGKGAGAAAHKLLKVIYAVLKRGTPYTPERPGCVEIPAEPKGVRGRTIAGSRSGAGGRVQVILR